MWAILLWIFMFMFLVLVHELGHFTAAKKLWVKVLEFGIGIPPKAFTLGKDKQGTEYTVNWIPLWWFVRMKGENPDDPGTFHAKDSFITAKLWKKLIILFAGVAVNFFVAWLFFSIAFLKGVTPINIIPENSFLGESTSYLMPTYDFLKQQWLITWNESESPVVIEHVASHSLADKAGIESHGEIIRVANQEVSTYNLTDILWTQFGKTFPVEIRDASWKTKIFDITCPEDECVLGVAIALDKNTNIAPITFSWWHAFVAGWHEMGAQIKLTFRMLGRLWSNLLSFNKEKIGKSVDGLSWPLGIIKVGETIFSARGIWMYLAFAGMISLALAIFNVLPIPALDGGRALWVLIQHFGRMKAEKYFVIENYFNMFFFALLMLLWIRVILMDLVRFWDVPIPFLS